MHDVADDVGWLVKKLDKLSCRVVRRWLQLVPDCVRWGSETTQIWQL